VKLNDHATVMDHDRTRDRPLPFRALFTEEVRSRT
jgi:hypothetical protein